MLDKVRNIGKQTMYYGLGSIINKLLGFILIPVYQSHIPIGDFGNLIYFETLILFLVALLNFGIGPAHQRFFYIEKEKKTYDVFLFNNFFGCLFMATIAILPILFFSGDIAAILMKSQAQSVNLRISMWIVVSEIMNVLPLQVLQYEQKPKQYLIYNAFKLIITFSLTIFLVLHYSMGIQGILYARLTGSALTILIAFFVIVYPRIRIRIHLKSIKQSINFGFPFVLSTLGYTLFMLSDRIMLNWLSTSEQVGKYGFGLKIANFINLIFVQTIGMSYFPSVMSNESQKDNIRYYRKMLTYYSFIMTFLILGFLFFYKDLLWVVGKNKEYWDGLRVVPILSVSFMIMGMNYFVQVGLFLKKKTKYYLIPSLSALLVNVIMNIFLIPSMGMMGAAYSVLTAQIIYTSLISFISGKYMKIGFEWNKVLLIYGLALTFFIITDYFQISNFFLSSGLKLSLLIVFPILLYKLHFFEQIEIQRVKEGFIKLLNQLKVK